MFAHPWALLLPFCLMSAQGTSISGKTVPAFVSRRGLT